MALHVRDRIAPLSSKPLRTEPQQAPTGALSEVESAQVAELRQCVEAMLPQSSSGVAAEAGVMLDDFTLLRFLQARPHGTDAALAMLRGSSEWRVERSTSSLFAELHPLAQPVDEQQQCRHAMARAHFYGGLGGLARSRNTVQTHAHFDIPALTSSFF